VSGETAVAIRLLALLILALAFTACRTLPVEPLDWPAEKRARQELSSWEMSGRAAVATASDGWSAGIRWLQSGASSELNLSGALGVGGVRVRSDGESFVIDTSKGEHIEAADASEALERAIGVQLPVRNLRFWLLGVPAPQSAATEVPGDDGHLLRLEQDGWVVTYDRYASRSGRTLPGRVQLERPPVRVRVIVERWDIPT
jgi:outer membrane lipoprotein LolB